MSSILYMHLSGDNCVDVDPCRISVTILLMLMHEGCCTIKCSSMTCRNYDGTCDGGRILVIIIIRDDNYSTTAGKVFCCELILRL